MSILRFLSFRLILFFSKPNCIGKSSWEPWICFVWLRIFIKFCFSKTFKITIYQELCVNSNNVYICLNLVPNASFYCNRKASKRFFKAFFQLLWGRGRSCPVSFFILLDEHFLQCDLNLRKFEHSSGIASYDGSESSAGCCFKCCSFYTRNSSSNWIKRGE